MTLQHYSKFSFIILVIIKIGLLLCRLYWFSCSSRGNVRFLYAKILLWYLRSNITFVCVAEWLIIRRYIQKFPDWVDNLINNNNKHSLRNNTKGYGGKTHYTDSQNGDITAPSGTELYLLQFSLQAASPETYGYTLVYCHEKWSVISTDYEIYCLGAEIPKIWAVGRIHIFYRLYF
jgi:hypothetical protein